MAVSELHSRLEHLVTYSSQLIFVSGDTIGQQQNSLQTFLSQQSENAELAFVNADEDTYEQEYRRQIIRQLLGDDSGLFNRPLNELLAPLNHHDGPVLICICQAEQLPPGFLQELWDLVLQSRFAGNKQHLNVILFGQTAWAEEAKDWLPAKNRDKPLLLSNESINDELLPSTELDKLIASKRERFEERLRARALPEERDPVTLNAWWFRVILGLAFIATFSGIMLWQYSDTLPDVWAEQQPVLSTAAESAEVVTTPQNQPLEAAVEIIETPVSQDEDTFYSDQDRITDWNSAIKKLNDKPVPDGSPASSQTAPELESQPVAAIDTSSVLTAIPVPDNVPIQSETLNNDLQTDSGEVNDYQVEDIVEVSQLEENAILSASAQATREQDNTAIAEKYHAASLLALDPSAFVIQIAGISSKTVVEEFIADNNLEDRLWIYKTRRFGGDWFVLLNRQVYTSQQNARSDTSLLPNAMQSGTPFVKSVRQVHAEITQQ